MCNEQMERTLARGPETGGGGRSRLHGKEKIQKRRRLMTAA